MITKILEALSGLKVLVTVAPREQAVRVRAGKHTKLLGSEG